MRFMDGVWVDGRRLDTRLQFDLHQYAVRLLELSGTVGEDQALVASPQFIHSIRWIRENLERIEDALSDERSED